MEPNQLPIQPRVNFVRIIVVIVLVAIIAAAAWIFFLGDLVKTRGLGITPTPPAVPLVPDDGRFRWGVQIRPYAMDRSSDELVQEQLDLAQELGVGWIRLDWHSFHDLAWHKNIVDQAAQRGMRVVLILEDIGVPTELPDAPTKAKAKVKEIASGLKGKVTYYQMFNEISGSLLKGPSQPGTVFTRDYDQTKYAQVRDWMKAAGSGIREVDASNKLIVSAQWTHTAMIEQLIKDQVPFDIVGWNWFSDMGRDMNVKLADHTNTTLLLKLKGFGKELWVTELGHRPGPTGQDNPAQADYIETMAENIHGYQMFDAMFVFELMDQSNVKAKGNKPEYYGIVAFATDQNGQAIIGKPKLAYDAYKQAIDKLIQQATPQ